MKKSGDITQLLALSLFIVILAFFIILNSISDFEQRKVLPVLASLEHTFASKILGQKDGPSLQETPKTIELFSGGSMDELEVSLKQTFDILSISKKENGRIMIVRLNRASFMTALQSPDSMGVQEFKNKLLAVLKDDFGNNRYRINVVFYEKEPYQADLSYMKSMPFELSKVGLQDTDYKLSVQKGEPIHLGLVFYPYDQGILYQEVQDKRK